MLLGSLLALAALFGTQHIAVAAPTPDSASKPIPPKKDPWYTAPKGYENAHPGQILRHRAAPGNLTAIVGNCSAAYNILYRTTDSLNHPTWAVTTVFVPEPVSSCDSPPEGYGSLLSYQIPYDSANLNESPSYQLYDQPPADIGNSLAKGWFVNVPDYEGPLASFTAGLMSGQATLDSVRAVRSAWLGIAHGARYALWGYSGGALASEWAAELQPTYAPELKFSGAALGGLTPNVTNVLLSVNGGIGSSLIPEGVLGLISQHPAAKKIALASLKTSGPHNKTGFLATKHLSSDEATDIYTEQNISLYFKDGFSWLDNPTVKHVTETDGIMGIHGTPNMPILAYKAINDEISPIADTDALVAKYCGKGVSILYERNTVGGHIAEATNGEPAANKFLDAVLAGTYSMSGCEIKNVTIKLSTLPERRRWAPYSNSRMR